jgi:CheY-like chemotaxis protein
VEILEQVGSRNSLAAEQRALIGRQTRAMAGLLDNVDGLLRDAGAATRREPIDLVEVVQHALTRGRAPLRPGQQLSFTAVERPLVVNGDHGRLHQVILNLLADAAERTPDGGQIEVSVYRDGNEAVLRLRDDGAGLDAERLRRFSTDPVPAAVLAEHTDADLRLFQVRQLVRLLGGWAQARRHASGRGNEFLVRLPVSGDAVAERRAGAYGGRRRVVVVEDDPEGRDTLRLLLRLAGHDVEVAAGGRQAVATILRHRPDIAFIDLGLPDLDGFEVARRVREAVGDSIRLVALTGSGRLKDHLRADDSGFEICLIKPVTAAELHRTLAQGPARP